jgi:small subunit ribosomal protein S6
MNREYEGVFILDNSLEDTDIDGALSRLENLISSRGGTVSSTDKWGRRRLAYEIKGKTDGFYAVVNFELTPSEVKDLDHQLRLDEDFIRFMIISKEER